MLVRYRKLAKWLVLGAGAFLLVGCATGQSGHANRNRNPSNCPINHKLYCDGSGHGTKTVLSNCRCIRHGEINEILRGY